MTRFAVLASLWSLVLALLLEPLLVRSLGIDADVALALAAALTSALLTMLVRERAPFVVPVVTEALVAIVVLLLSKPLRLSACDGEWCVADDARALSPWLFAAIPGSAALGVALVYGLRSLLPERE